MKVLVRLACCAALLVVALQAKADQVFDWSSSSGGFATTQYLGWFDNGIVSGNQYRRTVTRTSFAYISAPANPFPADLPHLVSAGNYVVNAFNQVVFRGPLEATLWNDVGDSLFAIGATTSVNGPNYVNEYQFVGGTGEFAGATGWWISHGTLLSASQQIWTSQAHLVLPSPVPEPESYAMLLAGLGLMAGVARRRKSA